MLFVNKHKCSFLQMAMVSRSHTGDCGGDPGGGGPPGGGWEPPSSCQASGSGGMTKFYNILFN